MCIEKDSCSTHLESNRINSDERLLTIFWHTIIRSMRSFSYQDILRAIGVPNIFLFTNFLLTIIFSYDLLAYTIIFLRTFAYELLAYDLFLYDLLPTIYFAYDLITYTIIFLRTFAYDLLAYDHFIYEHLLTIF